MFSLSLRERERVGVSLGCFKQQLFDAVETLGN